MSRYGHASVQSTVAPLHHCTWQYCQCTVLLYIVLSQNRKEHWQAGHTHHTSCGFLFRLLSHVISHLNQCHGLRTHILWSIVTQNILGFRSILVAFQRLSLVRSVTKSVGSHHKHLGDLGQPVRLHSCMFFHMIMIMQAFSISPPRFLQLCHATIAIHNCPIPVVPSAYTLMYILEKTLSIL